MNFKVVTKLSLPESRRKVTKQDLLAKFAAEDWHGVADAAMDLREIDVEIRLRKELSEG